MKKIINFSKDKTIPDVVNANPKYFQGVCPLATGVIVDDIQSDIGKAYKKASKEVSTPKAKDTGR